MPHRGRLNVLANTLDKPYGMIFGEFEDSHPETVAGDGDVKYHLGFSADHLTADGQTVHLSLTPNPSHLEAVNPVVEGRMRAKQRRFANNDRRLGVPILIHGDAAFAGQGLVAETLNLSQLTGYRTGGTVHIVVNNQIGFTTSPVDSRSTRYCTDVAKMIEVPIFHVNGEDPEAVVLVAELALDFRQAFGSDVVIDLVCYRRSTATTRATSRRSPSRSCTARSSERQTGPCPVHRPADRLRRAVGRRGRDDRRDLPRQDASGLRRGSRARPPPAADPRFRRAVDGPSTPPTRSPRSPPACRARRSRAITEATSAVPAGFHANPKIERQLVARPKLVESGGGDRLGIRRDAGLRHDPPRRDARSACRARTAGAGRSATATPSSSTSVTGESYTPLNNLPGKQAELAVYDSLLSEAAVLGFDYGYSLDEPNMLILWEAQFGDFANGAQVIIDQFIASAESKWGRSSGLVMLLPHGYEGQGPEHSSARLERFLQPAPRTTSRSSTRPPRRSTSTSSAARSAATSASR